MSENFFDDFDTESDLAEKGYGGQGTPMPGSSSPKPSEPQDEPDFDDIVLIDEYTEDQVSLLDQADARLEKGALYRMLLSHDLFGDVDCPLEIVHQVQEEIKEFILDRLNILLGIKAEQPTEETAMSVELPFNSIEIEVLKKLAATASKGKSVQEGYGVQASVNKQNSIQPLASKKKISTIKKLSNNRAFKKRELPKQEVPQAHRISRKKIKNRPEQPEEEKKMINAWEMTQEQRLEHNKKNQHKYIQTQPNNKEKLQMPDFDQQQLYYQTEIMKRANQPSVLLSQLQNTIENISKDELALKMKGG